MRYTFSLEHFDIYKILCDKASVQVLTLCFHYIATSFETVCKIVTTHLKMILVKNLNPQPVFKFLHI